MRTLQNVLFNQALNVEFIAIPLIDFLLPGSHFAHLYSLAGTRCFSYTVNDAHIPS